MTKEQEPPQPEQPAGVVPAPVPVTANWGPIQLNDGSFRVELSFATAAGVGVYYFPAPMAHGLAQGIDNAASAIDEAVAGGAGGPGLIVPNVNVDAVLRSLGNGGKKRGQG